MAMSLMLLLINELKGRIKGRMVDLDDDTEMRRSSICAS